MPRRRLLPFAMLLLGACSDRGGDRPQPAAAPAPAPPTELEAARVLLRHEKARIDGIMPPDSWPDPASVRRLDGRIWVVELDTSALPGGYPEQLAVEVAAAGGHTGRARR